MLAYDAVKAYEAEVALLTIPITFDPVMYEALVAFIAYDAEVATKAYDAVVALLA